MDFKLIGCILLIVGTSIGAGMLALPIATAQLGFIGSLILLFGCWAVMTAGAFLILEVNLCLPQNSNLISMARATIGPVGQVVAWISFLLLLYSLLSAYIAGGSDLFQHLLTSGNINLPKAIAPLIFTCILGGVVFFGIRSVDYVNRFLMIIKFSAYALLTTFLMPHIETSKLFAGDMAQMTSATALTVTITSFGYAAIVPSLRIYFQSDVVKLKKAILWGSLIPLFCYVIWDMVIMGVIPLQGENGLIAILQSQSSTSDMVNTLTTLAQNPTITSFAKVFTAVCVLTSFLGVGICLVDFLADGLRMEKVGTKNVLLHLLVFVPPLAIVLISPGIFVKALEYAGIYCIVLLILLPAWMAWYGRYHRHLPSSFKVPGGKPLLIGLIIFSFVVMVRSFI